MSLFFRLMPESVRWLVLQKRHTAALAVIKQAAKTNKTSLDSNLLLAQVRIRDNDIDSLNVIFLLIKILMYNFVSACWCWRTRRTGRAEEIHRRSTQSQTNAQTLDQFVFLLVCLQIISSDIEKYQIRNPVSQPNFTYHRYEDWFRDLYRNVLYWICFYSFLGSSAL